MSTSCSYKNRILDEFNSCINKYRVLIIKFHMDYRDRGYNLMKIIHIIPKEKFTAGYIDYFKINFPQYDHVFIVIGDYTEFDIVNRENIKFLVNDSELKKKNNLTLLESADKIIISGLFHVKYTFAFLPRHIQKKTFIHFWGADYSSYNSCGASLKKYLGKEITRRCINKCAGIINLIDGEYEEICAIFPNDKLHFVAPMLGSPRKRQDFSKFHSQYDDDIIRITLGNSATSTNRHLDAFEYIKDCLPANYILSCPLSYGDNAYRTEVIEKGNEIFGSHFVPITEFMPMDDYIQHLANCDVGVYFSTRQQGMGNITKMLDLGKTVYILDNTSMWDFFKERGYILRTMKEFKLEGIRLLTPEEKTINTHPDRINNYLRKAIELWKEVLEAKV